MPSQFFQLTDLGLATNSQQYLAMWLAAMRQRYPGYNPAEGNLEYQQAETLSSFAADNAALFASASTALFQTFGTQLVGLPFQTGNFATAQVLVTTAASTTESTYTMPAGTQFNLDNLGFASAQTVTINQGEQAYVDIIAVQVGSSYNNAGAQGLVTLLDAVDFVIRVDLALVAQGGTDDEDADHYLQRLTQTIQTLAQRPITANDYAIMALDFVPNPDDRTQQVVGRATAIDGYDPVTNTYQNEREVALAITDRNGIALNFNTMEAVSAWFQGMREANFIVNVVQPNYNWIYLTCSIHPIYGWTPSLVQSNVVTALRDFFSPAKWGLPTNSSVGWIDNLTIYESQVLNVIQSTAGVGFVENLGMAATTQLGTPSLVTGDVQMTGPFSLPRTDLPTIPITYTITADNITLI